MERTRTLKPFLRLPIRPRFISTRQTFIPSRISRQASSQSSTGRVTEGSGDSQRTSTSPALASLITKMGPAKYPSSRGRLNEREPDSKNAALHDHPEEEQPWHLHVYSTKHNCHLTLSRPNRKSVISISAGNIGFRKSQRGSYDAGYQLGAYLMARINRAGLLPEIGRLELILRGFGNGRDALSKVLLGTEGSALRPKVIRVTDATRLKFGGTRSKKPRRLG